jgi:hypothetical protein
MAYIPLPNLNKNKILKEPFTKKEQEIMDLICKVHGRFMKLPVTHESEVEEWVISIHVLQDVLGRRVLRRDYPNYFHSIIKPT